MDGGFIVGTRCNDAMTQQIEKPLRFSDLATIPAAPAALDFKKELRLFLERSNSEGTRRVYAMYLKEFVKYTKLKTPEEITDRDVLNWRDALKAGLNGKPNKEATIKTKLACVRSFFEYLKQKNLLTVNPANKYFVPPPVISDVGTAGRALSAKEVNYLLSLPLIDTIKGKRDYALMLLMFRCFMRVSEALSLKDDDFYSQKSIWYARLKIKGGERVPTPIPLEVKKAIDDYLFADREHRSLIKTRDAESGRYIFLAVAEKRQDIHLNKAISSRQIWHIFRQYGWQLFKSQMIEMKKNNPQISDKAIKKQFVIVPHDTRRTSITRALDQGETYRRVQNAGRIKSITTVQRYDRNRQRQEENSILTLNYSEDD